MTFQVIGGRKENPLSSPTGVSLKDDFVAAHLC